MRTSRALAELIIASLGVALTACSAMGLGDHELLDCDPDDANACSALNQPGQCPRYHCAPGGGCIPDVVGDERCDGIDNDCDELIDEGQFRVAYDAVAIPVDSAFDHAAHAILLDGTAHIALTAPTMSSGHFKSVHVTLLDDFSGVDPILNDQRCESAAGFVDCEISQLALAAISKAVVGVGIHRLGCGAGQLRIGVGDLPDFGLLLGSDGDHGSAVDLDSTSGCTRSDSPCEGARDPAVALLEGAAGSPAEALFVWLTPTADDPADCKRTEEFQLSALTASVAVGASGPRLSTSSAGSERLGDDRATGPATLIASTSPDAPGFVVAYPSRAGVHILFVPQREGRTLIASSSSQTTIEASHASDVVLARGGDQARTVAMAYRATERGSRVVKLAVLSAQGRTSTAALAVVAELTVEPQGTLAAGPVLAFAPSTFVDSGAPGPHGGWIVSWVERDPKDLSSGMLIAARIAERGAQVLNPRIELADGAIRTPFSYLKQGRSQAHAIQVGHFDDDALVVRSVSCGIDN